jgi:hypothetical protein
MHPRLHPKRPPALGVDIGRVIIAPLGDDGSTDSKFLGVAEEEALAVPPAPGAFESLAELWARFEGRVWLVSKAGPKIQQTTLLWLREHRFSELTGVPAKHVRFCRERVEKRNHAIQLGLTHFVDDRTDVLRHLVGLVPELYLFGYQSADVPAWARHVADWAAARAAIRHNLEGRAD